MPFETRDLSVRLGGTPILRDLGFALPAGGTTGIIGANGSGKTTLLRALAGLVAPETGQVLHQGRDIAGIAPRQLVARGRTPWLRPFLPMTPEDHSAVDLTLPDGRLVVLPAGL